MQIRQLTVENFRGVAALRWKPAQSWCCLIGSGDSGKSTVLDAIEAVLSPRWMSFAEVDFFNCDPSRTISIEVTVGELSKALKSDERFGLYIRGWSASSDLNDEPEDGDEPVLTVRLTLDATLEPAWELVRDSATSPRVLSNRDRSLFGLVRLSGDDARQLTWGQGSVLSKITGDPDEAARNLADAYRTARATADLGKVTALAEAATNAQVHASALGAYIRDGLGPGLELLRGGFSTSAIALHDGNVPLRLSGLGTRRLATLAIQHSSIIDGAIVLIDEIEHGLEPHRIIGAIARLKEAQAAAAADGKPVGQLLMTTHSDVAISEMEPARISITKYDPVTRQLELIGPPSLSGFEKLMKKTPRALFARRIVVCEGDTEVGLLLGLRDPWCRRHDGVPAEQRGVAFADGEGTNAPQLACALANLGYMVAMFRDSDRALTSEQASQVSSAGVRILEYDGASDTEAVLFEAADDIEVQALLEVARGEKGAEAVAAHLANAHRELTAETTALNFDCWETVTSLTGAELRQLLARVASDKKWFKERRSGRAVAPIAWRIRDKSSGCRFSRCIDALEAWVYG